MYCDTCNKNVTNYKNHSKTKKHNELIKCGGDLQKLSKRFPAFPWAKYSGEHHLPKYNFAGPGTRLDIRLDENNKPKPGEEPINRVDAAAYEHDLKYNESENIGDRQKADIDLIQD